MKYLFSFLLSLLGITLFTTSCSKDDTEPVNADIILSTDELTIPQQGETTFFYVKCNVDWTLTGTTDWCSASPTSGSGGTTTKVSLTVAANQSGVDRSNILYVNVGAENKTVTVSQLISLTMSQTSYTAKAEGETIAVKLSTAGNHTVTVNHDWISHQKGTRATEITESFVVSPNVTGSKRIGTVTFALKGVEETITIEQEALNIPAADATGMASDAMTLAGKMIIGWNLGNTLEASGSETSWGNPVTTQAMIDMVKEAGFNAVRIPCNWMNGYVDDTENCQIKTTWLARVKEVVDYCVGRDMYAIINIHWDGGWLENHPLYSMQAEINRKQSILWNQIATYFRDYDEKLLFAGTNEVHVEGVYDDNKVTAENHEVQQSFNQTFVDAVRATGGRNAYRNLIVQSYNTQINFAVSKLKMPKDQIDNRLMMEVHFYDPYDYALNESNPTLYWGEPYKAFGIDSWGQESHVDNSFSSIKSSFVDKGIPVIVGEFGANRHSVTNENIINSRAYYLEYVVRAAKKNGMVPFYWDNGGVSGEASVNQMAIFDRKLLKVLDQPALDALMRGATNP